MYRYRSFHSGGLFRRFEMVTMGPRTYRFPFKCRVTPVYLLCPQRVEVRRVHRCLLRTGFHVPTAFIGFRYDLLGFRALLPRFQWVILNAELLLDFFFGNLVLLDATAVALKKVFFLVELRFFLFMKRDF